jgi:uncharacterized protein YjbK
MISETEREARAFLTVEQHQTLIDKYQSVSINQEITNYYFNFQKYLDDNFDTTLRIRTYSDSLFELTLKIKTKSLTNSCFEFTIDLDKSISNEYLSKGIPLDIFYRSLNEFKESLNKQATITSEDQEKIDLIKDLKDKYNLPLDKGILLPLVGFNKVDRTYFDVKNCKVFIDTLHLNDKINYIIELEIIKVLSKDKTPIDYLKSFLKKENINYVAFTGTKSKLTIG